MAGKSKGKKGSKSKAVSDLAPRSSAAKAVKGGMAPPRPKMDPLGSLKKKFHHGGII